MKQIGEIILEGFNPNSHQVKQEIGLFFLLAHTCLI